MQKDSQRPLCRVEGEIEYQITPVGNAGRAQEHTHTSLTVRRPLQPVKNNLPVKHDMGVEIASRRSSRGKIVMKMEDIPTSRLRF